MSTFLEASIDKFTFRVATDRLYTADGLWVQPLGEPQDGTMRVRVGLSDYLQQHSGDAAFVRVTPVDTVLVVNADLAELETVKVNLALPSPFAGKIVAANAALDTSPEVVNQDPYGAGWLAEVAVPGWEAARKELLEPAAWFEKMKHLAEAEIAQP